LMWGTMPQDEGMMVGGLDDSDDTNDGLFLIYLFASGRELR
jgi:hypothetical protein